MNSVAKSGLNKAIKYFIEDDCNSNNIGNVTLSKLDAARMLAVAIIRQAVRDVILDRHYRKEAEKWLEGDMCENLLYLLGTNISGKDILRMAIKLRNERNKSNEPTSH